MTRVKDNSAASSVGGLLSGPRSNEFTAGLLSGAVVTSDAAGIVLGGLSAQFLWLDGATADMTRQWFALGLFAVVAILSLKAAGLYQFAAIVDPKRQVFRVVVSLTAIFFLLVAAALVFEVSEDFSGRFAAGWIAITIVLVVSGRLLFAAYVRRMARTGRLGRRILIYGATDQARRLIERIEALGEPWNHIIGVFDDRMSRVGPNVGRYPVLGGVEDLIAWGRENTLDEILIAIPWAAQARLLQLTRSLAVLPANVRLCPEIFHDEVMRGRASHHYGLPMWNAFEKPMTGWGAIGKRLFDIVFSVAVLLAAIPVLFVIGVLVKLESPGPMLFRQKRYGFNNEVIEVYKFRSMRQDMADPVGERLTERNDPRVTGIGRFIRRTSLDELPQLINVLRGEMSIVGPRPHALRTTAGGRLCEDVVDRYSRRHRVKPGITGWAQVHGLRGTMQDEEHLQKRIEHDLYYINNWSPWLDCKILALTLWSVIVGKNSY